MERTKHMNNLNMDNSTRTKSKTLQKITLVAVGGSFLTLLACGQKQQPAAAGKIFPTPDDAVVALVDAVKANDTAAVGSILGPDAKSAVSSGDDVADSNGRDLFVAAYYQQASLAGDDATKTLYIGADQWPFPIPVVKDTSGWRFDTASGVDEIRYRRIGRNEMATIDTAQNYVSAQKEYAQKSHDGVPAGTYAQKFASTSGKQDGLYWDVVEGQDPSPLGELAAEAVEEGYASGAGSPAKHTPFRGYLFRILTAQGANASGGARDYLVNGKMRKGFAMLAYPADYGKGGVMTFMVDQDGIVYEKDLGEGTDKAASGITQFDPDSSWQKVE
jgi:hypothetical protein